MKDMLFAVTNFLYAFCHPKEDREFLSAIKLGWMEF
jgi:hypothetical protein